MFDDASKPVRYSLEQAPEVMPFEVARRCHPKLRATGRPQSNHRSGDVSASALAETRGKLIQREEGVEASEASEAAEGKIKGHGAKRRFFQSAHRVGLHMGPRPLCRRSALKR